LGKSNGFININIKLQLESNSDPPNLNKGKECIPLHSALTQLYKTDRFKMMTKIIIINNTVVIVRILVIILIIIQE